MKTKIILGFVASIILSYLFRTIVGDWLAENYAYSSSFLGPENPEMLDGFIHLYAFFAAFLISLITEKIKLGLYFSVPIILFIVLTGSFNPHLWLSLILLAVGFGLAWLILKLQSLFVQKRDTNKNG